MLFLVFQVVSSSGLEGYQIRMILL